MHILFQHLKQLLLFFVYNLKRKIIYIENISKPTQKNLCFKQIYEFAYCLRMINMLISLLIYLIHLIRGLFLFSLRISLIPFSFNI
jgi:hypothetical protein